MRKIVSAVLTTALFYTLQASQAFAAGGSGERVGKNIGNLLGGWAKNLFVGICAVVALVFLLNRKFAELAVFVLAAVIVGGFVMAPHEIGTVIQGIWGSITK